MQTGPAVGIVGLGLVGGSLGLALRQLGRRVVGIDTDLEACRKALERGAADVASSDLSSLREVALLVLATPVETLVAAGRAAFPHLSTGTLVVDVCSVKGAVVASLESAAPAGIHVVGCHPMFGSAFEGIDSADAALIPGAPFLITPTERTSPDALVRAEAFARSLKMSPLRLTVEEHDDAVARVSHLTYLLATALTLNASRLDVAGPAFRDASRMAQSPPLLWRQILRSNREPVRAAVRGFIQELEGLLDADDDELLKKLDAARSRRTSLT
jgi:prephenate dehydrogenase